MYKLLLLLTFAIIAGTVTTNAQIQKGNVMVGGDISEFDISLNEGGNFSMHINPKAAWFIRNNMALGTYFDFRLQTAKGMGTATAYGVGLFGRYYINDPTINVLKQSRFFGEANAGIQGNNPYVGGNTNGLGIGFGPGLAYFVSPNVGLEALLKYNGIVGFGSSVASSSLNFSIGLQIYLSRRAVERAATNTQ